MTMRESLLIAQHLMTITVVDYGDGIAVGWQKTITTA